MGERGGAGARRQLRRGRGGGQLIADNAVRAVDVAGFAILVRGSLRGPGSKADALRPSWHGRHEGRGEQQMQDQGIRGG